MDYSLNQAALITGLTTRTLRNHIKQGTLSGEKIDGIWRFTETELEAFMKLPAVAQELASKQNAIVYDFLADAFKKSSRICTILDLPVSSEEAESISAFFCDAITASGRDVCFRSVNGRHFLRVILSGTEDQVVDLLSAYYGKT